MIWAAAARGGRVFTGEELMLCKQIQYKHKYCYCKQLQHKYKYNMSNENGTALQKWKSDEIGGDYASPAFDKILRS